MDPKSGLDIMSLPSLFQSIADDRKTGNLKVQNNLGEKYVYFRQGNVVQVSTPQNPSILAEGLRRHPDLDEESYQVLCKRQRKTGQSLASLILADDQDGQALVTAICHFQILEEICELFTWQNYHCEFTSTAPDPMLFDLEIINIDALETSAVLLEAARRADEWHMISEIVPSKRDIPYRVEKSVAENMSHECQAVYAMVDGFRSVEDILAVVRLSPFVAMSALASLLNSGAILLKDGKALLQLAKLDVFREDVVKRTKLYERAMELGEKNLEINLWLAHSYEGMGMKDKAASQYYDLGYSYLGNRQYEESARAFSQASQLNPQNFDAQERLVALLAKTSMMEEFAQKTNTYARWLMVEGQQDKAMLLLKEATEKYPKNLENLDLLASLYQKAGYKAEAIHTYRALANVRTAKEDYAEAAKSYEQILQIAEDNLEARKGYGEVLKKLGAQEQAKAQFQALGKMVYNEGNIRKEWTAYLEFAASSIIQNYPDDLSARKWLAEAYLMQDKQDKGIEQLRQILSLVDDKKNPELLVDVLKSLVKLEPTNFQNRLRLAETYLKIKKEREGIQEYFLLGSKAAETGKVEEALEAFDHLLQFDPSHYATYLKKAELLKREHRLEEAIQTLMLTGYVSMGADKLWQAVKAFSDVLRIDCDTYVVCYEELGRIYHKLGKAKESLAAYKKHVQKNIKLNNFSAALRSCDQILKIQANNEWAQKAKQKITLCLPKIQQIFQENA